MFGIENYAGFLAAGVLLNMLPGVDSVYVLTRSAAEGKRVGVASVFGISSGVLFHTTLVALGLSAVLAASPKAFFAVKLAGAAYLLWLGIKTFREKGSIIPTESAEPKKTGLWGAYLQGFLTNALNPKVALFFLAFMPAFVPHEHLRAAPVPAPRAHVLRDGDALVPRARRRGSCLKETLGAERHSCAPHQKRIGRDLLSPRAQRPLRQGILKPISICRKNRESPVCVNGLSFSLTL